MWTHILPPPLLKLRDRLRRVFPLSERRKIFGPESISSWKSKERPQLRGGSPDFGKNSQDSQNNSKNNDVPCFLPFSLKPTHTHTGTLQALPGRSVLLFLFYSTCNITSNNAKCWTYRITKTSSGDNSSSSGDPHAITFLLTLLKFLYWLVSDKLVSPS